MKTKMYAVLMAVGVCGLLIVGVGIPRMAQAQAGQNVELGDTETTSALVVGIDRRDRTLTLVGAEGDLSHYEVSSLVRNFDQIRVGDHVDIEYHQSVAIHIGDPGTQPKENAELIVARASEGAKPAGFAIGAVDASATIKAIDRTERTVTLEGHNGHLTTLKVDTTLWNFDALNVGDLVHARYTEAIAVSVVKAMPDSEYSGDARISFLFVQNSAGISYNKADRTLTLKGVNPAVTYFSDRPYRIAGQVMMPGFLQLWEEGSDSFEIDPPNANISILEGNSVRSAVIEIADPKLVNDQLTYTVLRIEEGDLPASGGASSLFIDGVFDGGPVRGGAKGAAGGAIIGAIAGDAGKGAAIGAVVGVVGGAARENQQEQAAAQAQANAQAQAATRVISVPNANGSYTPVTLYLQQNGWQGPRGEIYPTLPTANQLGAAYGM
jgi:hypothetical protein